MACVVIVHRQAKLPEVVSTLRTPCRFPRLLYCREQQCDQNGDDSDYHQQLNQHERFGIAAQQRCFRLTSAAASK